MESKALVCLLKVLPCNGTTRITARDPETNKSIGFLTYRGNFLQNLAVKPEAQRRGIGALLVDEVEQQMSDAGFDEVNLSIEVGNTEAERFWASHGYT
ncbi:hypothetical protein LCGC14_2419340, partial [marine sediment metagenome]